jgi:hypothetical protein
MEVAAQIAKLPIRLVAQERDDQILRDKRATRVWMCPSIATKSMGWQGFLTATGQSSMIFFAK